MPFVDHAEHLRMHYQLEAPADAATLSLSNSLGTNSSMWDAASSDIRKRFSPAALRFARPWRNEPGARRIFHRAARPRHSSPTRRPEKVGRRRSPRPGLSIGGMTGKPPARRQCRRAPQQIGPLQHRAKNRQRRRLERAHKSSSRRRNEKRLRRCGRALVHARIPCNKSRRRGKYQSDD